MSFLPKNLALMAQYLANFKRQTIRIRPMSNDSAELGQTIVFRLPANTLVDLHNLQIKCSINIANKTSANGNLFEYILPRHSQSLIERLDVIINGQQITGANNDYHALYNLLRSHLSSKQSLTGGGNAWLTRDYIAEWEKTRALDGTGTLDAGDLVSTEHRDRPLLMEGFLGFLSGHHVRFIDTAVTGPIEIRLRVANMATLTRKLALTAGSTVNVALKNLYMYCDTVQFTDDFYRQILARRLMDGGKIVIPYINFFGINKSISSDTDTVTFNIATQSLDFLVSTFRRAGVTSSNGNLWAYNDVLSGGTQIEVPSAFGAPYNNRFFTFESGTNCWDNAPSTTYQYLLMNQHYPMFPADVNEAQMLTKAAFDLTGDMDGHGWGADRVNYRASNFMFAQCFRHHAETEKIISGLDTRGASSNMELQVAKLTNSTVNAGPSVAWLCSIWAITTSALEISAGQNVVVIF